MIDRKIEKIKIIPIIETHNPTKQTKEEKKISILFLCFCRFFCNG